MAYQIGPALGTLNAIQSNSQLVRTSTNNLYVALVISGDVRIYKSTNNGISWLQKDYINAPFTSGTFVSIAIDGSDIIHAIFARSTIATYITFDTSTDIFGRPERIDASTGSISNAAIAIDTNNIPHVVWDDINSTGAILYSNRTAGSKWKAKFTINNAGSGSGFEKPSIQIDNNNVPVVAYEFVDGGSGSSNVEVWIGNKNNASSFSFSGALTSGAANPGNSPRTSLVIDSSNNVWLGYTTPSRIDRVTLYKHVSTSAWNSWQTGIDNGINGFNISLAGDGNDIYVLYERNLGGIAYDRYDTINQKWLGETIIQPQIISNNNVVPSFKPHRPLIKWSQYFNNGDTGANNMSQDTIEYLFDDGVTIYYDKLVTAQISTGYVSFSFFSIAGATTTSTSSTSSSTSTSISTSSTSTSVSTSTSSTSSSTSTSKSTSTSSTSSSISTSISTSSTSSSISTSSTSSSISTSSTSSSISTSSTSSSVSISTSISTSSTSSSVSTSISTSSTSRSTSTSSTSSSISTSSTSSSISTSSTSSSVSTSISTSSTSSSISTSISTSSTSSSISTSSTSSSISTSSTSSSTSTSKSTSTSSTSSSVSTSLSTSSTSSSISTSSTSRSTSTSSTSSSISTSSTSSSTSVSTSSTSSSTSTSQSTSTSTSVSFTTSTSSTSTSTTQSTSTSSTSQSTSVSTSTSFSSTSTSTTSTSTTTVISKIDTNTIPRATIRPLVLRHAIRYERRTFK